MFVTRNNQTLESMGKSQCLWENPSIYQPLSCLRVTSHLILQGVSWGSYFLMDWKAWAAVKSGRVVSLDHMHAQGERIHSLSSGGGRNCIHSHRKPQIPHALRQLIFSSVLHPPSSPARFCSPFPFSHDRRIIYGHADSRLEKRPRSLSGC